MANKMYYSIEEVTSKLGCSEEQVKGFVRSGKLREFRDAGKLNYRVDDVDKLAASTGPNVLGHDSDVMGVEEIAEIALSPDSGSGITKALSGSSSVPGLSGTDMPIDLGASDTGVMGLGGSTAAGERLKLDSTGEKMKLDSTGEKFKLDDAAKSGSGSTVIRLDDSGTGSKVGADAISLDEVDKESVKGMKKDDTVITNIGISVFDDDDLEIAADPMAKTLMTGGDEHLGLDGSGGGSGLLDLTRESDDTSLGAELLEGIDMGDTAETMAQSVTVAPPTEAEVESAAIMSPDAGLQSMALAPAPMVSGAVDPMAPLFTGLLIAGVISLALAGAACIASTIDMWPDYMYKLADQFWFLIGGTVVMGGLFALVGWLVARSAAAGPKPPKAVKEKPAKKVKEKKGKKAKGEVGAVAAK